MKLVSPFVFTEKESSAATKKAKKALKAAEDIVKICKADLDLTEKNTKRLYRIRDHLAKDLNRIANAIRED